MSVARLRAERFRHDTVRKMLRSACDRAGIAGRITHLMHVSAQAVADFYAETDFNAEMVAQEHGWAGESVDGHWSTELLPIDMRSNTFGVPGTGLLARP